jgi:hypothetical protein
LPICEVGDFSIYENGEDFGASFLNNEESNYDANKSRDNRVLSAILLPKLWIEGGRK